ncbi:unnamed protein product [Leptidea sinapis]|uniref:DNA polymerase alpha subunit B n=1 Tax=Leptidea sinapis TaxID=189913 RepID=A0A5E4R6Q0_9NEOP|nr:unnamed protein product [Leptidea sinapis]
MATEDLVTEQFQFLGIEVQNEVLRKCVTLCDTYNVDPETLVEQWMAFSLTHLNGAPPSIEYLEKLEKREFSKVISSKTHSDETYSSTGASLAVYRAPDSAQPDNDVLSNYMTTPKRVTVEIEHTTIQDNFHPETYSPNVDPSTKYASRSNQGSVVHSYGSDDLLQIFGKHNEVNLMEPNIVQVPNDDGELFTKAMFGFELLHEKASIYESHIRFVSQCIMKKNGIAETRSVREKTQNEVYVSGRIECDAEARLNAKCVVLQGTWEESLSQCVPLDLDSLKQYTLFPGQVVVVRGVNPRGDRFIAHQVYCDGSRPIPDPKDDMMNTLEGTLSMVIAAGPYTTSNNLSYEPLKDFISYINTHKPHAVLMTGPFLDCEHVKVKEHTMASTFKTFFEKLIDRLGDMCNTSPHTKVYIVSSSRDAFHNNIYPTCPYSVRKKHPNIKFVPDPSTLNINGCYITTTSTDVLMRLSQEEITFGMGGDKLSRLSGHLLSQQSLHPLCGAGAGATSLAVDATLWSSHGMLPATPHVLVLPSNFRYFVKQVNGCVVVNPERLTKGISGGTFARLLVSCGDKLDIAAQIVRI